MTIPAERKARMIELYESGVPVAQIAAEFNLGPETIRTYMHRWDIQKLGRQRAPRFIPEPKSEPSAPGTPGHAFAAPLGCKTPEDAIRRGKATIEQWADFIAQTQTETRGRWHRNRDEEQP